MNTIEKITNWLNQNPGPQTAAQIAAGIEVSASTVRKNIKKMPANTVNVEKISNIANYTLANVEAKVEPVTVPTFPKPEVTVPTFPKVETPKPAPVVVVSTPETPAVTVNPNVKATPRDLIAKLRQRVEKHRDGMENAYSPRDRQQHRRLWKRRTARLQALEAVHG